MMFEPGDRVKVIRSSPHRIYPLSFLHLNKTGRIWAVRSPGAENEPNLAIRWHLTGNIWAYYPDELERIDPEYAI